VRSDPVQFVIGDVVRLKKPHPCGGYDWAVVRLGADIGLKCQCCGRRVLLPRRDVERRLRTFLSRDEFTPHVAANDDLGPDANALDEDGG
jgi:hypothetical protein